VVILFKQLIKSREVGLLVLVLTEIEGCFVSKGRMIMKDSIALKEFKQERLDCFHKQRVKIVNFLTQIYTI
jgi:hypothetical protein